MLRVLLATVAVSAFVVRIEAPGPLPTPAGAPTLLATEAVSPQLAAIPGVRLGDASNNLDVADHGGRTYLAFRTAPTHFAGDDVRLYVVGSDDERRWRLETVIELGRDVREPRFLSWRGQLYLYFATLGDHMLSFTPERMHGLARKPDGTWTAVRDVYRPGFIPWRARVVGDRPYLVAYGDGRHIYTRDGVPLEVHFLTSDDGFTWRAAQPDGPAVLSGGGSEADFSVDASGAIVAVVRNEAGDGSGWGSKICTGQLGARGLWRCRTDPRKFDSPLLFRAGADVYLVARRHLRRDGEYDLGLRRLPAALQTLTYQLDYWRYRKRCAVWRVDPGSGAVDWQLDLPSRGDTCFPAVVPRDGDTVAIYNYSSPLDGADLPWLAGQLGRTEIYRSIVRLPGAAPAR